MAPNPKKSGKRKNSKTSKLTSDSRDKIVASQMMIVVERKLRGTEEARDELRKTVEMLTTENEALRNELSVCRRDGVEVAHFMQQTASLQDDKIKELQDTLDQTLEGANERVAAAEAKLHQEINAMSQELAERDERITLLSGELTKLRTFERQRATMQRDMDELRESLVDVTGEHQDMIQQLEQRYIRERQRLEINTEKQMQDFARIANVHAISGLNRVTTAIYQENLELTGCVKKVLKENAELRTQFESAFSEVHRLRAEKTVLLGMAKDRVTQKQFVQTTVAELTQQRDKLLRDLDALHKQIKRDELKMTTNIRKELETYRVQVKQLKIALAKREQELARIRGLIREVLHKRSQLEQFFLEALEYVRGHMDTKRSRSRHSLSLETIAISEDLPVSTSWEVEKQRIASGQRIDWMQLTWKQKEQVLRHFFVRMNKRENVLPVM